MNIYRAVIKKFTLLCLFTLIVSVAWSQTKEQLHASNPDFEKDHVHAKGIWPAPPGSYHPPEPITDDQLDIDLGIFKYHSNANHFNWLFNYVSWGTFFYFILMVVGVLYFSVAYRYQPGRKAHYTDGHHEHKFTLFFDILFFITLDLVLIYFSVSDTRKYFMDAPTGKDVVQVQVMPQQWLWNFRYAGNDGVFGTADDIVTVNELWVPKGKTLSLQIKSKDVIHGFMVPEVRHQIDALPGTVTKLWFAPTKLGDYEIACMHLCGTAHYKMKGFMKVVEQDDFEAWSKEQSEWSEARFDPNDSATHWGWAWLQ